MQKMCRVFFGVLLSVALFSIGCVSSVPHYDATLDGSQQLDEAIARVQGSGKYILVQVGGDWCQWCLQLNKTISEDSQLLAAMQKKFEWVHLYYGKANKNSEAMARLADPTDMGFPAFVLLDSKGVVLRKIGTGVFEEGDGYSKEKLLHFLETLEVPESGALSE